MICLLHSMQLAGWVAASREKGSHNPIDECCREDLLSMKSCRIFPHVLDHCGKIVAKFKKPSHPLTIWIVWTLTSLNLLYNQNQKRPSTCATTFRNDRSPPNHPIFLLRQQTHFTKNVMNNYNQLHPKREFDLCARDILIYILGWAELGRLDSRRVAGGIHPGFAGDDWGIP